MVNSEFDSAAFLKNLTTQPGIYKMLNSDGEIIYVGKAKNLKNRVSSYFKQSGATPKQQIMVSKIAAIEITVTETENEALLLECKEIKRHQPRYNICLRDDKSYPYIFLSKHDFPQISLHRGAKRKAGQYFGPYPSSGAARETLKLLQRLFPIRQCEDSVYNHRTRPCLQYQIGRCSGPCVGLISQPEYAQDVTNTELFLTGKKTVLIDQLISQMETAAERLEFEIAAKLRDQIARLRSLIETSLAEQGGDIDVIACITQANLACVQVFFIRNGQHLGNKVFFPNMNEAHDPAMVLQAFISQYYLDKPIPREIVLSHRLPEVELLRDLLARLAKQAITISHKVKDARLQWLHLAMRNAETALFSRLAAKQNVQARFAGLQQLLNCPTIPERLECFDISHTQGSQTVASCVVFDQEGAVKSAYRRFNITGITAGDDYAAIYQAVLRRFKRVQSGEQTAPDIVFIDGGKGQVQSAEKALAELAINSVMIVGVAKGEQRKSGLEKLILGNNNYQQIDITMGGGGLLIQQIRDEAHRFAITGHRQRRAKASHQSVLETISGLGSKRRQMLLKQFGGLQGVAHASVDALCSIEGISRTLAQRIYDSFHPSDDHSI